MRHRNRSSGDRGRRPLRPARVACRRYPGPLAILGVLLVVSIARAGWQPDPVPANHALRSPFSLDSGDRPTSRDRRPSPAGHPAESSPFALPDENAPAAAALPGKTASPFALPAEADRKGPESPPPEESAADLLDRGTALAREGKYEEARIALARSLEKDPANLVTLNNLGLVMRKLGRIEEALQAYQFALEIDDTYALTYKNLGVLLEKNGEEELAAQAYRKYCRLAPDAGDAKNVAQRADWLERKHDR